jgi:hypothetical protein
MGEVSADDEIVILADAIVNRGCPTPEQNQFTVDFPLVDVYVELSTVSWNVTYG